jgi:hypothetical protein
MKRIEVTPQRIELDWLKAMKVKLDEQDALLKDCLRTQTTAQRLQ